MYENLNSNLFSVSVSAETRMIAKIWFFLAIKSCFGQSLSEILLVLGNYTAHPDENILKKNNVQIFFLTSKELHCKFLKSSVVKN